MAYRSLEYVVSGTVQGVGFRQFLRTNADRIGIIGWVKNDPKGDVIGVAQGKKDAIAQFRGLLARGPRHATVTNVQISSERSLDDLEFLSFEIRY